MNDKILGAFLGAAVGDAMGAATETRSAAQISEKFGGRVTEFKEPPADVPAAGRKAGQITDAFSIPYMLAKALINTNGKASRALGEQVLRQWGESEYFAPFAGMTTRNAVKRLAHDSSMSTWAHDGHLGNKLFLGHYYALSSNGAAVKAFPVGIMDGGHMDKAIADTIELTVSSHDDPYSISGACAVSAAVCEAMKEHTSVFNIVQAAQYGSIEGERLARERTDIHTYPGPSVTKRIDMAIKIALHSGSCSDILGELRDRIGCGPAIAETVPTALGLLIAEQGKTMPCILDGVNIGDETSAIACITGALTGAYNGISEINVKYEKVIEEQNHLDLRSLAEQFAILG